MRVKAFGEYLITGNAGNYYTVRCERRGSLKVVDCNCVAGTFGTPCLSPLPDGRASALTSLCRTGEPF